LEGKTARLWTSPQEGAETAAAKKVQYVVVLQK
jgi:hypothetical protein